MVRRSATVMSQVSGNSLGALVRAVLAAAIAGAALAGCSTVERVTDAVSFDSSTYAGDVAPTTRPQVAQTSTSSSASGGTALALAPDDVVAGTPRAPQQAPPPQQQQRAPQAPQPAAATSSAPTRGPSQPVNTPPDSGVAFPNLADVPDEPDNLPSDEELTDVREDLEADREAANQPSGGQDTTTSGTGAGGSIMQSLRDRLEQSTGTAAAPSGPVSIAYGAGETAVPGGAGGQLSGVASQVSGGGAVRIVGYALVDGTTDRAAALGVALQRANAVAAALVNQGVDASRISVFGNAVTETQVSDIARARRVDVFVE